MPFRPALTVVDQFDPCRGEFISPNGGVKPPLHQTDPLPPVAKELMAVLRPEEQREIEEELAHYPNKQAVCIDAMRIVQRHRGWVSDESLHDIAGMLEMSIDELDSVASFYNLIFHKPVGRHVIMVCDSVSCWIMGYERLREQLMAKLGIKMGETTADGRFTLLPIVCLGACDHAPVMMVDEDLHQDIDPQNLNGALEKYK
ncbi:MAG: NADH-quinone oxidoreductase subunit NuoE [Terriglobia bacterium]